MNRDEFEKLFGVYHKKFRPNKLLLLIEQTKEATAQARKICETVLKNISAYKENDIDA